MTADTTFLPFFRSFMLGKTVELDKIHQLSRREKDILNIETLAALKEARHNYDLMENKQSEEAGTEYRRIKVAGYFQAALELALKD